MSNILERGLELADALLQKADDEYYANMEKSFALAIVGTRAFTDYRRFCAVIDAVNTPITAIVSGGAKGTDTMAAKYAREHDITLIEYLPNWDEFGKSAGYRRNVMIVERCDAMIAFHNGTSKGTQHDIDIISKTNKPLHIVPVNGHKLTEKELPLQYQGEPCSKCDGTGHIPHYAHIFNGDCFRCGKSGKEPYAN